MSYDTQVHGGHVSLDVFYEMVYVCFGDRLKPQSEAAVRRAIFGETRYTLGRTPWVKEPEKPLATDKEIVALLKAKSHLFGAEDHLRYAGILHPGRRLNPVRSANLRAEVTKARAEFDQIMDRIYGRYVRTLSTREILDGHHSSWHPEVKEARVDLGAISSAEPCLESVVELDVLGEPTRRITLCSCGPFRAQLTEPRTRAEKGQRVERVPRGRATLIHDSTFDLAGVFSNHYAALHALVGLSLRFRDPTDLEEKLRGLCHTLVPPKQHHVESVSEEDAAARIPPDLRRRIETLRDVPDAGIIPATDPQIWPLQYLKARGTTLKEKMSSLLEARPGDIEGDIQEDIERLETYYQRTQTGTLTEELNRLLGGTRKDGRNTSSAQATLRSPLPWSKARRGTLEEWVAVFRRDSIYRPRAQRALQLLGQQEAGTEAEALAQLRQAGLAEDERDIEVLNMWDPAQSYLKRDGGVPSDAQGAVLPPQPARGRRLSPVLPRLLVVANGLTIEEVRPYMLKALAAGGRDKNEPLSDSELTQVCAAYDCRIEDGRIFHRGQWDGAVLLPGQVKVLDAFRSAGGLAHRRAIEAILCGQGVPPEKVTAWIQGAPFIRRMSRNVYALVGTPLDRVSEIAEAGTTKEGEPFLRIAAHRPEEVIYFPDEVPAPQEGNYRTPQGQEITVSNRQVTGSAGITAGAEDTCLLVFHSDFTLSATPGLPMNKLCLASLEAR